MVKGVRERDRHWSCLMHPPKLMEFLSGRMHPSVWKPVTEQAQGGACACGKDCLPLVDIQHSGSSV